VITNMCY